MRRTTTVCGVMFGLLLGAGAVGRVAGARGRSVEVASTPTAKERLELRALDRLVARLATEARRRP